MNPSTEPTLRARLESAVRCDVAPECTVAQLAAAHDAWAQRHYPARAAGGGHGEARNLHDAMQPVLLIYGDLPAESFGPIELQAVQLYLVQEGYCRNVVNAYIRRIRKVFKWACSRAVISGAQFEALRSVQHVAAGRMGARETKAIAPIDPRVVELTLRHVANPEVAVMARLQLLTGMRPCEVCRMHSDQVDTDDGSCWLYTPAEHKMAWRGRGREVFIGGAAIDVLRPAMKVGWLFLTRQGRPYTANSYGQALKKAALRAGLEPWWPNRLRHTAASIMRRKLGSELTQFLLGHAKLSTTEIYAERNRAAMTEAVRGLTLDDVMQFKPRSARTA